MNETFSLYSLFFSAFTSATLLPGTSDAALIAILWHYPEKANIALMIATLGNSLGSILSYVMGRMLPEKIQQRLSMKTIAQLKQWGTPLLLLSWVPIIGDALPLAAGWLRLNFWYSGLFLVLGKFLRYIVLMYITLSLK